MIVILLFKQNESLFHTHGMKAESMTIILCRYVFHTRVCGWRSWMKICLE